MKNYNIGIGATESKKIIHGLINCGLNRF